MEQNKRVLLVSRNNNNQIEAPVIQVLPDNQELLEWKATLIGSTTSIKIGHDIETKGDYFTGDLLLSSFYSKAVEGLIVVVDNVTVSNWEIFTAEELRRIEFISHSGGFEGKWHTRSGFLPFKFHCTMVRDQVLTAGVEHLIYSLVETCRRRGVEIPVWMNKDIRAQFADHDGNFTTEQVLYNAGDSLVLPDLYDAQNVYAERAGQLFLVNSLRSRAIRPLCEAEMTGFVHNQDRWLELAAQGQKKCEEYCKQLDELISSMGVSPLEINKGLSKKWESYRKAVDRRDARIEKLQSMIARLESSGKTHLKSYTESVSQLSKTINSTSLPPQEPHVMWSSSKQVIDVIKRIGCPMPMGKDVKTKRPKAGIGKGARADWFSAHEGSPFIDFMTKFDKYKKILHNVNSFGEQWIKNYYNPHTGKVHTVFRQADTATLRLSSGKKSEGYFNLQQIPAREGPEYRACFGTDPGRGIITLDYTGCEIVCMISLSRDLELKRISELPDQHSYMGTKCWRAVYQYRYEKTGDPQWKELAETYVMENVGAGKKMRTKFKESGVFPVIYGVHAPKVASIQGFTKEEGQIFINTIEAEMPNVVSFVKQQAQFALENGYVVHNNRARSRRWFWPVIERQMYGHELTKSQEIEIESAARNTCVQGTNVDIVIEAMCMIDLWKRLFNIDIRLLGQVHDELIYDCPIDKLEWTRSKLVSLMERAAQNYLIPEISMKVDSHIADHWVK